MMNNRTFSEFVASLALNSAARDQIPMPSFVSARGVAVIGERVVRVAAGIRHSVPGNKALPVT
jgi:hypothetical protein